MGKIKEPDPALLFIAMLYSGSTAMHQIHPTLEREFGESLLVSAASIWNYTGYYNDELGWPLFRQFVFFKNAINPGDLADIKVRTSEIEDSFSVDGKRRINLDPGYLTLSKIVLASTKDYAHRVYLRRGIYAEITLYYQDGIFQPHLFTYRDYEEKSSLDIFMHARGLFRKQLSEQAR